MWWGASNGGSKPASLRSQCIGMRVLNQTKSDDLFLHVSMESTRVTNKISYRLQSAHQQHPAASSQQAISSKTRFADLCRGRVLAPVFNFNKPSKIAGKVLLAEVLWGLLILQYSGKECCPFPKPAIPACRVLLNEHHICLLKFDALKHASGFSKCRSMPFGGDNQIASASKQQPMRLTWQRFRL